jgi:hypothetical protein
MYDIAPDIGISHSLHGRRLAATEPEPHECEGCYYSGQHGEPCELHEPAKHAAHMHWCRRQEIRDRTWNALRVAWAMAEGQPVYDNGYGHGLSLEDPTTIDIPF